VPAEGNTDERADLLSELWGEPQRPINSGLFSRSAV